VVRHCNDKNGSEQEIEGGVGAERHGAPWDLSTDPTMNLSSSRKNLSAFPPVKSGVALQPRREDPDSRRGFESRRQ